MLSSCSPARTWRGKQRESISCRTNISYASNREHFTLSPYCLGRLRYTPQEIPTSISTTFQWTCLKTSASFFRAIRRKMRRATNWKALLFPSRVRKSLSSMPSRLSRCPCVENQHVGTRVTKLTEWGRCQVTDARLRTKLWQDLDSTSSHRLHDYVHIHCIALQLDYQRQSSYQ